MWSATFEPNLVPTTFRRKFGKFGVTIEFKFVDIVATFFDEKNIKMRSGPLGKFISNLKCFESKKRIIQFIHLRYSHPLQNSWVRHCEYYLPAKESCHERKTNRSYLFYSVQWLWSRVYRTNQLSVWCTFGRASKSDLLLQRRKFSSVGAHMPNQPYNWVG